MEPDNIKESGLLEVYAMGIATREEQRVVETAISENPQLLIELDQIENVLENLAIYFAKTPQKQNFKEIKSTIFEADQPKQITSKAQKSGFRLLWNPLSVAASLALVLVGGYALYMYSKAKAIENQLAESQSVATELAILNQTLSADISRLTNLGQAVGEEASQKVVLTSTKSEPVKAIVLWNPLTKKIWLVSSNLPRLPEGKQYQLWGIVNGQPIDAGVFNGGHGQDLVAVELKTITRPSMFAVTVEKQGGSPTPDLSTLCLKAEI